MNRRWFYFLASFSFAVSTPGFARSEVIRPEAAWTQKIGSQLPLNEIFLDEEGRSVRLHEFFRGKPVILNFAYLSCPNLCPLVLNGLTDALMKIKKKPGTDYRLLTISIDPNDTSRLALMKKRTYSAQIGVLTDAPSVAWNVLRGDSESIRKVSESAGFGYSRDGKSSQFDHPTGFAVISADGVVRQYFMGIRFDADELERAIETASRRKSGSVVREILMFCSSYNPMDMKITARVIRTVRWLGGLAALMLLGYIASAFRREAR